jgi:hypothetical protein
MHRIFLTAAHMQNAPLAELVTEIREIEKALRPLQQQQRLEVQANRAANIEDIFTAFSQHPDISILHYAGHADDTSLYLEETGSIKGIAEMFGLNRARGGIWNNLRFIFLNGCASRGQVASLHASGVAAVIATSRSIEDPLGLLFATTFYHTWALEGKTLAAAFATARARVLTHSERAIVEGTSRGIALHDEQEFLELVPWGLYLHPELQDKTAIESWVINEPPKLPPMLLAAVKPNATQSLLELVHEFRKMIRLQPGPREQQNPLMILIERLPWIVGTHLRRLFAVDSDRTILQPNRKRLKELITAYSDLTQFINYIMLSMLWDSRRRQQLLYAGQYFAPLPFDIIPDKDTYQATDYIYRAGVYYERLQQVGDALIDPIGLMDRIGTFLKKIESEANLRQAYLVMEGWKQAMAVGEASLDDLISSRTNGQSEALPALVLEAEAIYARLLKEMLFLTEYRLHTVRSIVVDKLRNLDHEHPYSHYTMSLHAAFSQLQTMLTERKTATDNYCLLLTRQVEGDMLSDAVNLSPFYLDRSSYIDSNTRKYPAVFTLDYRLDDGMDAQYFFHYIDNDVNHQYAFEKDHELAINSYGALLGDYLEADDESQIRFERIYLQLQQLALDIPHQNPDAL